MKRFGANNERTTTETTMKKVLWTMGFAAAMAATAALAAPYVILPDGRKVEGQRIRALPDGTINLQTAQGTVSYQKGMYAKAVADRPAELDSALKAVQAQKYDEAVKALEKIAKDYRFLDWDVVAQKELAKALMAKGDGERAVAAFTELFKNSEEERNNTETQWLMRKAMLTAKQYSTLTKQLDAVVAGASREDAAKAQTMRGDVQKAQNNLEPALLDYLRTATLFDDVKDPNIQAEACFKAAQILETMRDPRAKELYKKVAEEYRSSPFAKAAAEKAR
jgi:tetratricopeptide (TPR) repeat protein